MCIGRANSSHNYLLKVSTNNNNLVGIPSSSYIIKYNLPKKSNVQLNNRGNKNTRICWIFSNVENHILKKMSYGLQLKFRYWKCNNIKHQIIHKEKNGTE